MFCSCCLHLFAHTVIIFLLCMPCFCCRTTRTSICWPCWAFFLAHFVYAPDLRGATVCVSLCVILQASFASMIQQADTTHLQFRSSETLVTSLIVHALLLVYLHVHFDVRLPVHCFLLFPSSSLFPLLSPRPPSSRSPPLPLPPSSRSPPLPPPLPPPPATTESKYARLIECRF